MGKTIIISERQLNEILGADSSYLDNMEGDFQEYNGNTEISVNGKLSDKSDGEPITGDDFASKLARHDIWTGRGRSYGLVVNCATNKKKKIVEANQSGKNRSWVIPDKIYSQLKQNLQMYNGDKNAPGYDRLNNLINKRDVEFSEMENLKDFFDNDAKNDPNHFNLIGGIEMQRWVDNTLNSFRSAIASDKANRAAMGFQNVYQKVGGTKDSGNGQAHSPKNSNITYEN